MPSPSDNLDGGNSTQSFDPNDSAKKIGHSTVSAPPSAESAIDFPFPPIPNYRLVRYLDVGGMGAVFEVINQLNVPVAIKVIRPDRNDSQFLERFRQEAKVLQELRHRHIVRIFHFDVHEGYPYFAMELIRGGNLASRLSEFQADRIRSIELMIKIIDAVAYLHECGKVHRDLKPKNILLDEQGEPFLSDFGIIKVLGTSQIETDVERTTPKPDTMIDDPTQAATKLFEGGSSDPVSPIRTLTGAQLGTRPYMAPEQVEGRIRDIGPHTDIWAIGVILYELLGGKRPFESADATVLEQLICRVDPVPVFEQPTRTEKELNRIVHRCLQKDPQDRYPSANELKEDLQNWLDRQSPSSRWSWRKRVGVVSFVILFGILAAFLLSLIATTPVQKLPEQTPLQRLQERFAREGRINLLDSDTFDWVETFGQVNEWKRLEGGGWSISTPKDCLIEFGRGMVSDTQAFRYRVVLRSTIANATFGPYVGRREFKNEDSIRHCFYWAKVRWNKQGYTLGAYLEVTRFVPKHWSQSLGSLYMSRPIDSDPDGWMKLEIEVSPQSILLKHDGRLIHQQERVRLMGVNGQLGLNREGEGFGNLTPTFAPSDGIGLYLDDHSEIEIREMTLERIQPKMK